MVYEYLVHGRYPDESGRAARDFSPASEDRSVAWLEHELAGGLCTWEALFKEKGYMPSGIRPGAC